MKEQAFCFAVISILVIFSSCKKQSKENKKSHSCVQVQAAEPDKDQFAPGDRVWVERIISGFSEHVQATVIAKIDDYYFVE